MMTLGRHTAACHADPRTTMAMSGHGSHWAWSLVRPVSWEFPSGEPATRPPGPRLHRIQLHPQRPRPDSNHAADSRGRAPRPRSTSALHDQSSHLSRLSSSPASPARIIIPPEPLSPPRKVGQSQFLMSLDNPLSRVRKSLCKIFGTPHSYARSSTAQGLHRSSTSANGGYRLQGGLKFRIGPGNDGCFIGDGELACPQDRELCAECHTTTGRSAVGGERANGLRTRFDATALIDHRDRAPDGELGIAQFGRAYRVHLFDRYEYLLMSG